MKATASQLTIRNVEPALKRRLRVRAAHHGRSMEEEARQILRAALVAEDDGRGLGDRVHARFAAVGGVELALPRRERARTPPDFSR
jgi:plasmid stability protein